VRIMRHSLFVTLCCLVMTSAVGLCQPGSPVNPNLVAISVLQRKGEDAAALKAGKALLASGSLSTREQVQLLNLLALANADQSNFAEASRDYEQALARLGHDASATADRAAVLDDYGALYRDQGQLEVAIRLRLQALAITWRRFIWRKSTLPRRNDTWGWPRLKQSWPRIWMWLTGPRLRRSQPVSMPCRDGWIWPCRATRRRSLCSRNRMARAVPVLAGWRLCSPPRTIWRGRPTGRW
jgi:tetratricopeptide (TPR) repeat protein